MGTLHYNQPHCLNTQKHLVSLPYWVINRQDMLLLNYQPAISISVSKQAVHVLYWGIETNIQFIIQSAVKNMLVGELS